MRHVRETNMYLHLRTNIYDIENSEKQNDIGKIFSSYSTDYLKRSFSVIVTIKEGN